MSYTYKTYLFSLTSLHTKHSCLPSKLFPTNECQLTCRLSDTSVGIFFPQMGHVNPVRFTVGAVFSGTYKSFNIVSMDMPLLQLFHNLQDIDFFTHLIG